MRQGRDESTHLSVTNFFVIFHLVLACIEIVLGFITMFAGQTIAHFTTALSTICACLWMFGIVKLMKYVMVYVHKRYNTGEMKRCRNQMIAGFAGISMCGIVLRIVSFYVDQGFDRYVLYCFDTTCLVSSIIFFYHFVGEFRFTWRLNYKKEYFPLISILLAIQITAFIITMKVAYDYQNVSRRLYKTSFIWFGLDQFVIMVIFASSLIDIGVVLAGGLEKKNGLRLESVEVVQRSATAGGSTEEVNSPKLECKICMEEYSESVIPRMLKECGHTICEKCAEQLLDDGQHLFCPFCQGVTVVKGPVNQLPKNFAITNMIDEKSGH